MNKFICQICNLKLSTFGKLNQHKLKFHNVDDRKLVNIHCEEPNCDFKCGRISLLISHLQQTHQIQFDIINRTFESLEGNYFILF